MTTRTTLQVNYDADYGGYPIDDAANLSGPLGPTDDLICGANHNLVWRQSAGPFSLGLASNSTAGYASLQMSQSSSLRVFAPFKTYGNRKWLGTAGMVGIIDRGSGLQASDCMANSVGQQANVSLTGSSTTDCFMKYRGTPGRHVILTPDTTVGSASPAVIQPSAFAFGLETDFAEFHGIGPVDVLRRWTSELVDANGYAAENPLLLLLNCGSFRWICGDAYAHEMNAVGAHIVGSTAPGTAAWLRATVALGTDPGAKKRFVKKMILAAPLLTDTALMPCLQYGGPDITVEEFVGEQAQMKPSDTTDRRLNVKRLVPMGTVNPTKAYILTNTSCAHEFETMMPVIVDTESAGSNLHVVDDHSLTTTPVSTESGPMKIGLMILDGRTNRTDKNGDGVVNTGAVEVDAALVIGNGGNVLDNIGATSTARVKHMTLVDVNLPDKSPLVLSEAGNGAGAKAPLIMGCLADGCATIYANGTIATGDPTQTSGTWDENVTFNPSNNGGTFSYQHPATGLPSGIAAPGPSPVGSTSGAPSAVFYRGQYSVTSVTVIGGKMFVGGLPSTTQAGDTVLVVSAGGTYRSAATADGPYDSGTGLVPLGGSICGPNFSAYPAFQNGIPGLAVSTLVQVYIRQRSDVQYGTAPWGANDKQGPDPMFVNRAFNLIDYALANGMSSGLTPQQQYTWIRAQIVKSGGYDNTGNYTGPNVAFQPVTLRAAYIAAFTPTNPWYALNKPSDGRSYGAVDIAPQIVSASDGTARRRRATVVMAGARFSRAA